MSWTKKASSDSADEKEPAHPSLIEAFAVGVIAGAMAQLLKFGVAALGTLRVHLAERVPPDLVLPMMGLIGGLLCGVIIQKVAPDITGSGIPQVKATLRGTKAIGLQLKDLLSKLVGGILALGCGMPLGREGPTVQMGAAVAYLCNRLGIGQNKLGRHFIAAGAGAGLAAAFNAPLAGMIFVVEELVREVKSQFVIAAGLACFGATVILRLVSVHSLDISPRSEFPAVVVTAQDIPSLAVLGIICGALGAVFNSLIIRGCLLTNKAFGKNFPLRIGLAGLICGVVVGLMPQAFRDFAGIKYMFVAADPGLQMGVTVLVTNFILTVLAYAAGAPGGLFGPSLTIGAALGYLMSTAHGFLPGGSIQSQS
ncbi:MAG TPA: chloride channel protein, partial [Candidatus Obscuribacterales bacterium]